MDHTTYGTFDSRYLIKTRADQERELQEAVEKEIERRRQEKLTPKPRSSGRQGDVLVRLDNLEYGGHHDWRNPGADLPYMREEDADLKYVFKAGDTLTGQLNLFDDPTEDMHPVTLRFYRTSNILEPPNDGRIYGRAFQNGQYVWVPLQIATDGLSIVGEGTPIDRLRVGAVDAGMIGSVRGRSNK